MPAPFFIDLVAVASSSLLSAFFIILPILLPATFSSGSPVDRRASVVVSLSSLFLLVLLFRSILAVLSLSLPGICVEHLCHCASPSERAHASFS